jgi:hypothetical protein
MLSSEIIQLSFSLSRFEKKNIALTIDAFALFERGLMESGCPVPMWNS